MSKHLGLGALIVLLAGCGTAVGDSLPLQNVGPFKDDPRVTIVSPTAGQTVNGGDVAVKLSVSGKFKLVPPKEATDPHKYGEGHFHLFLDVSPTPPGEVIPTGKGIYHSAATDVTLSGVSSGHHTLWVELGFSDHIPYQQTLTQVEFTVTGGSSGGASPAPEASASPTAAPSAAPSAAASPSPVAQGATSKVNVVSDPNTIGAFNPNKVTIKVGDSVEWDFQDSAAPHTTTSDDGTWDSGSKSNGDKFSFQFTKTGTYTYKCSFHPQMTGTITVQ